jgi:hypothetical protein
MAETTPYTGFEQGRIRPPSEANSLLLRITRNCPWNRCRFCGLYRGETFSVRPVEHLFHDIDQIKHFVEQIQQIVQQKGDHYRLLSAVEQSLERSEREAFHAALRWLQGGMTSVFLQDANSLVIKASDLIEILEYLRHTFPQIERVTSYARSHSVAKIADADLRRMAQAGLNRIHIGLESAADGVLDCVNKGVDKQTHIVAGQKVKRAGIELSEYFMPGLGGVEHSIANALETADALNQINPDFIRIRSLVIPQTVELYQDVVAGDFIPLGDIAKAKELLMMIDHLEGIQSTLKSDHIVNLFQEVEGQLPHEKERMTAPIRHFLAMDPEAKLLYLVGRRCGIFSRLDDLQDANCRHHAQQEMRAHGVTWNNVDAWAETMLRQYI